MKKALRCEGPRIVCAASDGGGGPQPEPPSGPLQMAPACQIDLRVLATSDLHGQLMSYDYFANRPLFGTGLAQTAALIAEARAGAANSILLDNGDFLQGTALTEMASHPRGRHRNRPHPAITAFNALGYDAVGLGNHEFDYGLERLTQALADARFPAVSATVVLRPGAGTPADRTLVPPWVLLTRHLRDRCGTGHDIGIGVLGLTPPETLDWAGDWLSGRVWVRPMLAAARDWVPKMRAEGADVVICLVHSGLALPGQGTRTGEVAAEIAALDGVDAVIAGHTHQVFPPGPAAALRIADPRIDAQAGQVCGTPTVQPGHSGSHLGMIDLELTHGPRGWRVTGGIGRAISASEVVAGLSAPAIRRHAAPLRAAIGDDHRAALAWTRRRLGQTTVPLTTHFAHVADTAAMRLVAAAKEATVRRLLSGRPEAALPLVATVTPFRCGGRGGPLNYTDIRPGPLSVRHVHDLYPFPNSLRAVLTTGADLLARLEHSARLFRTLRAGRADQPLIDPAFPPFEFELAPALSFRIDLSRSPGSRIRDLCLAGEPVPRAMPLVLVTNSYRMGGHGGPGTEIRLPRTLCTEALAAFVAAGPALEPARGAGWSLAPLAGASVLFDSGTGAAAHLSDVAHLRPELLGLTEQGFRRFRLHL
ncbi:hypothetical protein B6K69_08315 [Fuscovulum blasticum]|nr:hypothetical protein B6K69_08315 [Fuscovulum blasticum]